MGMVKELKCGWPVQAKVVNGLLEYCNAETVTSGSIEVEDVGTITVPLCNTHFYAFLGSHPDSIVRLVVNGLLRGEITK
jgi:hypothetical protein